MVKIGTQRHKGGLSGWGEGVSIRSCGKELEKDIIKGRITGWYITQDKHKHKVSWCFVRSVYIVIVTYTDSSSLRGRVVYIVSHIWLVLNRYMLCNHLQAVYLLSPRSFLMDIR